MVAAAQQQQQIVGCIPLVLVQEEWIMGEERRKLQKLVSNGP
jgi:hypothetical protein